MKCPLWSEKHVKVWGQHWIGVADCFKEKCAWWDEVNECCGDRTKRKQLERIADKLGTIAKELTLLRPIK